MSIIKPVVFGKGDSEFHYSRINALHRSEDGRVLVSVDGGPQRSVTTVRWEEVVRFVYEQLLVVEPRSE